MRFSSISINLLEFFVNHIIPKAVQRSIQFKGQFSPKVKSRSYRQASLYLTAFSRINIWYTKQLLRKLKEHGGICHSRKKYSASQKQKFTRVVTLFVSSYMSDLPLMFAVSGALPNQLVWAGTSQTLVCTDILRKGDHLHKCQTCQTTFIETSEEDLMDVGHEGVSTAARKSNGII